MLRTVIISNNIGNIVHIDTHSLDIFGYLPVELIGKSIEMIIPEKDFLRNIPERGGKTQNVIAIHKSGEKIPIETIVDTFGNKFIGTICTTYASNIPENVVLTDGEKQELYLKIEDVVTNLEEIKEKNGGK